MLFLEEQDFVKSDKGTIKDLHDRLNKSIAKLGHKPRDDAIPSLRDKTYKQAIDDNDSADANFKSIPDQINYIKENLYYNQYFRHGVILPEKFVTRLNQNQSRAVWCILFIIETLPIPDIDSYDRDYYKGVHDCYPRLLLPYLEQVLRYLALSVGIDGADKIIRKNKIKSFKTLKDIFLARMKFGQYKEMQTITASELALLARIQLKSIQNVLVEDPNKAPMLEKSGRSKGGSQRIDLESARWWLLKDTKHPFVKLNSRREIETLHCHMDLAYLNNFEMHFIESITLDKINDLGYRDAVYQLLDETNEIIHIGYTKSIKTSLERLISYERTDCFKYQMVIFSPLSTDNNNCEKLKLKFTDEFDRIRAEREGRKERIIAKLDDRNV